MNIFAFDPDPVKCALWLDNKRVGKLLMEAMQLLSVAIIENDTSDEAIKYIGRGGLCKPTHVNHPVAVWVRSSVGNFNWTKEYATALRDEYAARYNGTQHGAYDRMEEINRWSLDGIPEEITEHVNCAANIGMNIDYKHLPVYEAYREYILQRWRIAPNPPAWSKRNPPAWYVE